VQGLVVRALERQAERRRSSTPGADDVGHVDAQGAPSPNGARASGRRQTSPAQGVLLYCRELEARGRGARGEDDEEGRLDLPERLPAGREVQDRRFPGSRIEAQGRARAGQLERTVQERDT